MFITLNKPREAFNFLASTESRVYANSRSYSEAIASLVRYITTLPREKIESVFLSASYTARQEQEIAAYVE